MTGRLLKALLAGSVSVRFSHVISYSDLRDRLSSIKDTSAFDLARDELHRLLEVFPEPELTAEIGALVSEEFGKFVSVEVEPAATIDGLARPMRMIMKPGDLFLRLIAAARANDSNVVWSAIHDIRSLIGVATTG